MLWGLRDVRDQFVTLFAYIFTEIVQCTIIRGFIGQESRIYLVVQLCFVRKGLDEGQNFEYIAFISVILLDIYHG